MTSPEREAVEAAIGRALLEQWDPLGVREQPGAHEEYTKYVPAIYSLLARGREDGSQCSSHGRCWAGRRAGLARDT